MPSFSAVASCLLLAAFCWTAIGLAVTRSIMPGLIGVAAAPAMGWAIHSVFAVTVFRWIGFDRASVLSLLAMMTILCPLGLFRIATGPQLRASAVAAFGDGCTRHHRGDGRYSGASAAHARRSDRTRGPDFRSFEDRIRERFCPIRSSSQQPCIRWGRSVGTVALLLSLAFQRRSDRRRHECDGMGSRCRLDVVHGIFLAFADDGTGGPHLVQIRCGIMGALACDDGLGSSFCGRCIGIFLSQWTHRMAKRIRRLADAVNMGTSACAVGDLRDHRGYAVV